jgi:hypothetical protein
MDNCIWYVEYKGTDNHTYLAFFLEYSDGLEFQSKVNGTIYKIENGSVFTKKGFIQQ